MADESVIKAVCDYLRLVEAHGIPVRFGVMLGSQAAGTAGPWSDIDLLVIFRRFDTRY